MLPGDHFGERALLHDRIWQFTAVAAERSILVALGASVFDTLIRGDTSIRELLLKTASKLEEVDRHATPGERSAESLDSTGEPKEPILSKSSG